MEKVFDKGVARRGTDSYKWDTSSDDEVIPLSVADMDFPTAQPIIDALEQRVKHGAFGYTKVPENYFNAIIEWFSRRHSFYLQSEWILFTTGVVPAISAVIKALASPGDRIIIQSPVYNCFYSSINNNECLIESNDLIYDLGVYSVDFDDLERKAANPLAKVLLLCNPHNPAGRVWTIGELTRIGEICIRNNVNIISDEIHGELISPGYRYTPFASLNPQFAEISVTLTSPSKAFNLAGIQVANIIAPNEILRKKIDRVLNINEVCEISPFAITALIAAYSQGTPWLEKLNIYIHQNYLHLKEFFLINLPGFHVLPLEGTYLVWIDCSILQIDSADLCKILLLRGKLWINEGTLYGNNGKGFIRINIACPIDQLKQALSRFLKIIRWLEH